MYEHSSLTRLKLGIEQFLVSPLDMKSKFKNSWSSIVPLHVQKKSTSRFCVFPKDKLASYGPGNTPVYLNVYDLTPVNGYFYWAGIGIFHSGVEVHGREYAFGAHDFPTSGVFEVEPHKCPGYRFRKSIFIGTTCLNSNQVREFMQHEATNFCGDTYHLVVKNCNHFSEAMCFKLTRKRIPKWVNRLARMGSHCNCILPESLKATTIGHELDCEKKGEKRSLSCFSSISMHHKEKEVSISSLFLHSHYKGCLPPWELKTSRRKSLKEG